MLLYIIPFVLLLVVAIVLKKRETNNQDAGDSKTNKKVSNKKSAKKNVAKTARTNQRQQTQAAEPEAVVVQETVVEVSADLKQKIESLISAKNYSAAEAQINLALNQDNRQHALYLYLLDIHLAQKDEFAVDQLVQHLHALNLEEIAQQAEEKKTQLSTQKIDVIEFNTATETTPVVAPIEKSPVSTDAFDALVDHKPTTANNSFDLLQNEYSPSAKVEAQAVELTSETTITETETTIPPQLVDLEFTPSLATQTITPAVEESTQPENNELAFNLAEPEKKADQPQTHEALDFSFGLETNTLEASTATPSVAEEIATPALETTPLEFSFDTTPPTTVTEPTPVVDNITEFKMDFDAPIAPSVSEPIDIDTTTSEPSISDTHLDFKLDTPAIEPVPSFSFDLAEEPQAVPTLDIQEQNQPQVTDSSISDPLAQAFPDVLNTHEIALNLDLAEQYITLGAYDAARQLLAQDQDSYSVDQKLQSQNLLNQIAS